MPIDFYYTLLSPPCRAVQLLGEALGITFNLKSLDLREKQEHLSKEFTSINPQHCVPTIVDGNFTLWESRAIMCYLVEQYGKTDSLYPKSLDLRAKVDRLLFFDMSFFDSVLAFASPVFADGKKPDQSKLDKVYDKLGYLEEFLEGHLFAVGNRITLADYALVTTVGLIDVMNISLQKFPKVSSWFNRCTQQMKGYYKVNNEAINEMRAMIKGKLRTYSFDA